MIGLLLFWANNQETYYELTAIVEVDYMEFDAVYLPPDYYGPIVAIPADETYFQ